MRIAWKGQLEHFSDSILVKVSHRMLSGSRATGSDSPLVLSLKNSFGVRQIGLRISSGLIWIGCWAQSFFCFVTELVNTGGE